MPQIRYAPRMLAQQLKKELLPFYLVYGAELFLLEESAKLIRDAVTAQGNTQCLNLTLDGQQSHWDALRQQQSNQSLFTENLFIELKIPNKISVQDNEKLLALLSDPTPSTTFLIKVTQNKTPSGKWFSLLEKQGLVISHYPLTGSYYSQWLVERAKSLGLVLSANVLQLLVYHTESNCLAGAQELERLSLFYGANPQTPVVISHIDEQSQFDVFDLCEAILTHQPQRILKMIHSFKNAQAVPLTLVIWAIAQMLRALLDCSAISSADQQRQRLQRMGIRASAQSLYLKVLNEHTLVDYAALLRQLSGVDKQFKSGDLLAAWRNIIDICLFLAKLTPHNSGLAMHELIL